MILVTIVFGALYGCIVAFVWSLANPFDTHNGLIIGSIIGGLFASVFGIRQKLIEVRYNKELRELTRSNATFFFMLMFLGVASGLIAWLIRFLFF